MISKLQNAAFNKELDEKQMQQLLGEIFPDPTQAKTTEQGSWKLEP